MDYILNWIDTNSLIISKNTSFINDLIEWRRTIENDLYDHVKDIADEYIANYDWSEVPQFDVLSRSIATKADKTIPVEANSIALLDVNGNLVDSGKKTSEFAPESHAHSSIVDTYSHTDNGISVDNGGINISVDNGESSGEVDITAENIGNLHRALQTPDNAPTEDSDNFVTSGGVKTALDGKAPANYVPWKIEKTTSEGTSRVLVDGEDIEFFIEDVTGDDPREVTATLNFSKMLNFARALENPSSIPEDNNNKLITSKAVYDALAGKMSTTPVPITITRSGSSYPLQDEQGTEQDLNAFIAGYPENKHFICNIEINNGSGEGYATGVAYWKFKSSEDEIYVYVRIGVKEFVAIGQSQGGESVSTWSLSWVLNDYSQNFF